MQWQTVSVHFYRSVQGRCDIIHHMEKKGGVEEIDLKKQTEIH